MAEACHGTRCAACCQCPDRDLRAMQARSVAELNGRRVWVAPATGHHINPTVRLLGAEIEVSNLADNRTARSPIDHAVSRWDGRIVSDGSLPSTGFEIQTAPASGDRFVEQVTAICTALAACGAQANSRCGLHVHVDCRDFDYLAMRRLVRLYALLEPAIFALIPPERRTSQYCKPCGAFLKHALHTKNPDSAMEAQAALDAAIYAGTTADGQVYSAEQLRAMKAAHGNSSRYHALNLHSWAYRGTVEARMFPGTVKGEKISMWGMLWAALVQHAHDATESRLAALRAPTVSHGVRVLCDLAPTPTVREWLPARYEEINARRLDA